MTQNKIFSGLTVLWIFCLTVSCQPTKKTHEDRLYLRGIDSISVTDLKIPDPIIQKGDVLSIIVFSDNPEATVIYNQSQSGGISKGSGSEGAANGGGYLVDIQGNIRFQTLGLLHVDGLTKLQLIQLLQEKLTLYLKNPYVEIRFLNARVTMLGEISKPGIINIPEQKISLLDAIALSGDLTTYGRRDNILVVREKNGKRETARLDIRNPSVYQSEYFYLQQNDLVYIEPVRKKPSGSEQIVLRNVSIASTIISTLAIVISLFR